jgi:segregation and condensation protein B
MAFAFPYLNTENRIMEISQIIPHVESLIFAADRPLPLLEILDLLNNALAFLEDRASLEQVETALDAIKEKYSTEFYPFEVRESGGGYQFLTKREYYQTVAQLNGEKFLKRLSTAALETLAIVAYKQPISKGEIEHIRGVSTDYSIQKLLEKELIVISGRSETLPGKPLLYSTSKAFMDYFGLNSPKDLPKLKEVFDDESIQPTLIGLDGNTESPEEDIPMVVSETGELVAREVADNEGPDAGLNGHHVDIPEEVPVVDEDVPVKDEEDADENEPAAEGARLTIVGELPVIDEPITGEVEEDIADSEEDSETGTDSDEDIATSEDDIPAAEEDNAVASEDDIAAFLESAASLGPKGDDEDDEEGEDEDEEEDDDDGDSDEDSLDEDDDLEEDDDEEEDGDDEEDEEEEEDDADEEDGEDEEEEIVDGNKKEEDVDDEGFYKDEEEDFNDEDEDEDDDEDNRK